MKILKQVTRAVEIGGLDNTLRLPTAARISAGMKTTCAACGKPVTDEFFITGFKAGHRNMILHESCAQ